METLQPSGFLIIDKPKGITSHDVIYQLRKITVIKKIGHAGTLDPFATGVLIVAVSRQATKQINNFAKLDKTYIAKAKLGAVSDTYDPEGKIIENKNAKEVSLKIIKDIIKSFEGEIEQIPPMFSAKKVGGKKLYQLAREGKTIERQPCTITISKIKIIKYKWPYLDFEVKCSTGTYIRSLAHDIGQKAKTGAYLEELQRTAIGKYKIKKSVKLDKLNSRNWQDYLIK